MILTRNRKFESGNFRNYGFTLIELLIVVAIIAILAAIAIPNFLAAQIRAKAARVDSELRSLATALESYYVDNNAYVWTTAISPIEARWLKLTTPVSYISSIPLDPFGDIGVTQSIVALPLRYRVYDFITNDENYTSTGNGPFFQSLLWPQGYSQSIKWYMASQGPDLVVGAESPGVGIKYDPTNGTVTPGDIIRVGP